MVAGVPDRFATVDEALAYFGKDAPPESPVRRRYEAYLKKVDGGYVLKRDTWHRERMRKTLAGGATAGPDLWAALGKVRCPILAIRGTRSDMFAAETVGRVRSANPDLTLVEVVAGHDVAGDNPAALLAEVSAFLERTR
jgi:pimeloyl-ACP methyl ester carboxylesterase